MPTYPPAYGDQFTLRVTLRHITTAVWRLLHVPAQTSLGHLHEVLQVAFGWQNSHLHDFTVGKIRFGMVDVEDEIFAVDEHAAPLGAVARASTQMVYRYDFGDDWEHDIVVENVKPNGGDSITCSAGARACPPEDCGGPPGYENVLRVLSDPNDDEFASVKEWVGRKFNPERFDSAAVSKRLAALARRLSRRRG